MLVASRVGTMWTMADEPEAEYTGDRTHYLPQFLLQEFKGDGLFELDKQTGGIERRNVRAGGQIVDLYPQHIERGLFRQLDTSAARILQGRVYGQSRIELNTGEQEALAEWLVFFAVRIPRNLDLCNRISDAWNDNPYNTLDVLDGDFGQIMTGIKTEFPERYEDAVEYYGSAEKFEQVFHGLLAAKLLFRQNQLVEGRKVFEQMHTSGTHKSFIHHLLKMRWTWVRTNGEFIIGDNPLCRWHTKKKVAGHGLGNRDLEITIPLSKRVTLWMHRNYNHEGLVVCNAKRTRELNKSRLILLCALLMSHRLVRSRVVSGMGLTEGGGQSERVPDEEITHVSDEAFNVWLAEAGQVVGCCVAHGCHCQHVGSLNLIEVARAL